MKKWKRNMLLSLAAAAGMGILGGCGNVPVGQTEQAAAEAKTDGAGEGSAEMIEKNIYRTVSMDTAVKMMEEESGYVILDVRTQAEYKEKHIPGAVCIPNETIGMDPPEGLPDKQQLILVYCRSGNRSRQAAQKLADMGYTNVVEFGGILDWKGETVSGE